MITTTSYLNLPNFVWLTNYLGKTKKLQYYSDRVCVILKRVITRVHCIMSQAAIANEVALFHWLLHRTRTKWLCAVLWKISTNLDVTVGATGDKILLGATAAVQSQTPDGHVRLMSLKCLAQLSLSDIKDADFTLLTSTDQHLVLWGVQHHWTAIWVTLECCSRYT